MLFSVNKTGQLLLSLSLLIFLSACGGGESDDQGEQSLYEESAVDNGQAQPSNGEPDTGMSSQDKDMSSEETANSDMQSGAATDMESAADKAGDAENGKKLFNDTMVGAANAPGCVTCHSVEPGAVMVGPSMANMATTAADRVANMSAAEYLRQSIVDPNAHVVEGYTKGVMYQQYGEQLSEKEINDLVAYLMTLK